MFFFCSPILVIFLVAPTLRTTAINTTYITLSYIHLFALCCPVLYYVDEATFQRPLNFNCNKVQSTVNWYATSFVFLNNPVEPQYISLAQNRKPLKYHLIQHRARYYCFSTFQSWPMRVLLFQHSDAPAATSHSLNKNINLKSDIVWLCTVWTSLTFIGCVWNRKWQLAV